MNVLISPCGLMQVCPLGPSKNLLTHEDELARVRATTFRAGLAPRRFPASIFPPRRHGSLPPLTA